jgi:hypothetical protein
MSGYFQLCLVMFGRLFSRLGAGLVLSSRIFRFRLSTRNIYDSVVFAWNIAVSTHWMLKCVAHWITNYAGFDSHGCEARVWDRRMVRKSNPLTLWTFIISSPNQIVLEFICKTLSAGNPT